MQQLTVTAPGSLEWQDVPRPRLRSAEAALVRPVAVATCDFDHLLVAGRVPLPLPVAVGHECVAEVVETGPAVGRVRRGDLVVVPFQVSCGACVACRRGMTSACAAVPWLSAYGLGAAGGDWGGAVSDLLTVPWADGMLVALPPDLQPAEAAAAGCNVPDAWRCVGPQLEAWPGAPVLVVSGAFGSIGLYAVAMAIALGSERVGYVDADPVRAARAAQLGAEVLAAVDVEPGSFPVTVDASQDPDLLRLALRATAPGGTCTASTMYPQGSIELPLMEMFARCATFVTGQPHARPLLDDVLGHMARRTFDLGPLTDRVVSWDEAPDAFAAGAGKSVCLH